MSKTWAIVLSVIGGLFLLGIIVVGGFVYWFYQKNGKLIRAAVDIEKLAKEFGAKTDNEGCLNEAMSRQKSDKSITGRLSTTAFLTVCLQESKPSPGFCDSVPASREIIKSGAWRLKKCADAGLQNDQGCQQLFGVVQSYCQRSK